jgi:hypothetical protein
MGALIIVVIVAVVVVMVLVSLGTWYAHGAEKRCRASQACRLKPMCADRSQEACAASYEAIYALDDVMSDCASAYVERFGGQVPSYYLKEHPRKAFSYMKRSVHVVLRKGDGSLYDGNTLAYVGLHELAHVLCSQMDGDQHGAHFRLVFERLCAIASERGYYDPELPLDAEYPSS